MEQSDGVTLMAELFPQPVGAVFGPGKDQNRTSVLLMEEVLEQSHLLRLFDAIDRMRHTGRRGRSPSDLDFDRVSKIIPRQGDDLSRQRGRE
jgi:hypothetical protein